MKYMSDHYEGIEGVWLSNRAAEAFVSATPYPRVVAFRLKNSRSPFRTSTTDQFYGIRSWYLEPEQVPDSPLPALQPAVLKPMGPRSVRLAAAPEKKTGLQLTMEVALNPKDATLVVRHGFKNLRRQPRRLAAWSIMAFPHQGMGLMPWPKSELAVRSYLFYPGVDVTEPCLQLGKRGTAVDFEVPTLQGWVKTGVNSDAGWAAYVWRGQAWKSSVTHVPGAEYPEGGGTMTLYSSGKTRSEGFCEVENVGPLTDARPGQTVWLEQTIDLCAGLKPRGAGCDAWLAALTA